MLSFRVFWIVELVFDSGFCDHVFAVLLGM